MPSQFDVVVLGGGVVGCCVARALASSNRRVRIGLLEKEESVAKHTSSRNSGVIHSGFHMKPGTLRAKLCVAGARRLKEYCMARRIPLLDSGTLVLATTEDDLEILGQLEKRGRANSVITHWLEKREMKTVEPYVNGLAGLHAPEDAIFDSRLYVSSLAEEAEALGVRILLGTKVNSVDLNKILEVSTNRGTIITKFLVNCAGGHAVQLAKSLGMGHDYTVVPFRGEYYEIPSDYEFLVRSAVYPAPDLTLPFLGVHLTRTVRNTILVGPNAVPAFAVENYSWSQVRPHQVVAFFSSRAGAQLMSRPTNVTFAVNEILGSLSKRLTLNRARKLVPFLKTEMMRRSFSGVRPQLVDKWGRLTDDLVLARGESSLHILNAISPALTTSLELADYIVDMLKLESYIPAD